MTTGSFNSSRLLFLKLKCITLYVSINIMVYWNKCFSCTLGSVSFLYLVMIIQPSGAQSGSNKGELFQNSMSMQAEADLKL